MIVSVDFDDRPAERFLTSDDIVVKNAVYRTFYGYFVTIVKNDKFIEFLCACDRACLVTDTFHKATFAANGVSIMIYYGEAFAVEFRRKFTFGNRHTYGVSKTLT